ncbi:hypothetical protein SD37_11635 [Amycolatopsis orientalis]|uniref:Uncharacterized protein n=1 Tax=Amycolatopsis orientalis TaxID=31958 RepID=A0A193BVN3_AMYOR|nr:hypothetical protein [Amycolatopsis orientalis]ANN16229.1 hypothetical protein SD37_11635 [Amycolatopsis orientalis]
MNRVPAKLVLHLLNQEADKRGDDRLRLKSATLRSWVHRRHITRGSGGYDLAEILRYLEQRDRRADTVSAERDRAAPPEPGQTWPAES